MTYFHYADEGDVVYSFVLHTTRPPTLPPPAIGSHVEELYLP